jgi:hypothetical protein
MILLVDYGWEGEQLKQLAFGECAKIRVANLFKHSNSVASKGIQYASLGGWVGVWG